MVKVFFLTVVRTKLALELLSFYVLSIISYIGQGDFKDLSIFSFTILSLLYLVYYGILMVHEGRYYFFYHPKKILKFRIDLIRFAIVFSLVFLPYLLFLSIVSGVYFNYLLGTNIHSPVSTSGSACLNLSSLRSPVRMFWITTLSLRPTLGCSRMIVSTAERLCEACCPTSRA